MRLVILESPYAGDTDRNLAYARDALRDCLRRGESPYASHLLLPQVLDDADPEQRRLGIAAGLAWGRMAHATVVYLDLGLSAGMKEGIAHARNYGRAIEYRSLPEWRDKRVATSPEPDAALDELTAQAQELGLY